MRARCSLLLFSIAAAACQAPHRRAAAQPESAPERRTPPQPSPLDRPPFDRAVLDAFVDGLFGAGGSDGPGAAVLVVHDGRVLVQRQYGKASLEHGVPFTPEHRVRLPYSEGREFLAIAAVLMENDGRIGLDDRARDHFPGLPAWSAPVTLRDLIHHRSGFVDEWSVLLLMHGSMANRVDGSQFLRLLYDQPAPEVEPCSGYLYSNSDYGLLRLILEQAADEGLSRYMERRMFGPLGMGSTHLVDDFSEVVADHAAFYAPEGDGYRHQEIKTSPGGDYVVVTTASDLARWAEAHSDPRSELSGAVARLLDGAAPLPGRDGHYAFGHTIVEVAGTRVVRHEGVLECNYLTRIPDRGLSIITFGNRYYEPAENRAIVDLLLGSAEGEGAGRLAREPVPVSVEELGRYAGQFVTTSVASWESRTMARDLIRIGVVGSTLELDWPSWGRFELLPLGDGSFSWQDGERENIGGMLLEFGDPERGGPLELVIRYSDGHPAERFVRLEPWTPSPALLRRLAGTYHSAHLDYSWTLRIDGAGELVLRAPTMADVRLEPYQENEFLLRLEKFPGVPSHAWARFHEDEVGNVTHLTVWNPRLIHHRLDRR